MSDKINEAIKDIAVKHGVVLGEDDPILILQTMNEKMLEENRKAQQDMLTQFKEEMENISSQWKVDAKEKAEKVLNAALAGSKDAMDKILRQATSECIQTLRSLVSELLVEASDLSKKTRNFSQFTLLSFISILTGGLLFVLFFL